MARLDSDALRQLEQALLGELVTLGTQRAWGRVPPPLARRRGRALVQQGFEAGSAAAVRQARGPLAGLDLRRAEHREAHHGPDSGHAGT